MGIRSFIKKFNILRTALAIVLSFAIVLLIIVLVSKEPLEAFKNFFMGPISSLNRVGSLVEATLPLIFAGLACVVMFETGFFTLGVEGCFFFGAYWAAVIATQECMPASIHPILALLVGGFAGALIAVIPTALRMLCNVDEFVSSLLLNYAVLYFTIFLLKNMILSETAFRVSSVEFQDSAMLTKLIPDTRITTGVFIAIACVVFIYILHKKSKYGFEARTTGQNKVFAASVGINTSRVIWISQLLGGFIAGIGGAVQMLSVFTHFNYTAMPGYGFNGIIVSTMVGANPALVPLTAIFLAYIQTGADIMGRMNDVPSEIVSVLFSVIVILVVAKGFLSRYEHKYLLKLKKVEGGSDDK